MSHENSDHPLTLAWITFIPLNGRRRPGAGNASSSLGTVRFPLPTGADEGELVATGADELDPIPTGEDERTGVEALGAPVDPAAEREAGVERLSRETVLGGNVVASERPPGPGMCGPPAEGICSQYWFSALTVGLVHGAPGIADDAAAAFGTSGARVSAGTTTAHVRRCLLPKDMASVEC